MSLFVTYTMYMNNVYSPQQSYEKPLFTVFVRTMEKKSFSWDFIMKDDKSIALAGKTIEINKHTSKKLYKASELKTKAQFTIETNLSFPCSEYTYLPSNFMASSYVEVRNCSQRLEKKTIAWFANIPPLLLAIENKDSLLVAEIFYKKSSIFMEFPGATIKLLESISVEGLFSWVWGRFDNKAKEDLSAIFNGKCTKPFSLWGVSEAFFTAARRRLDTKQNKSMTIDECMTVFLSTHPGTKITLGIVGSNHYRFIEKNLYGVQEEKKDIGKIFSQKSTIIEAELNNTHDENALALYFENNEKQIGTKKAISGYIRKTGAELLRKANPKKTGFSSRLTRLGYLQGGSNGIVIELVV